MIFSSSAFSIPEFFPARLEEYRRDIEEDRVLAARVQTRQAPKPFPGGRVVCRNFLLTGAHDRQRVRLGKAIESRTPQSAGLRCLRLRHQLAPPAARSARSSRAVKTRTPLTILLLLLGAALSDGEELKQETLQAWDAYVQTINSTMEGRATGRSPFLSVDESPDLQRRVRGGEMLVTNHDPRNVPHGLIHHWVAAMFLPNVTLDQVLSVIDNYDRYSDFYKPFVVKSGVLERTGGEEKVILMMVQRAFSVTAAVETEDEIQIVRLNTNRIYIVSNAIRVQEIADYGQPNEHPFPEDRRPGYLWRTVGVTRLEQRDSGVYVEIETVALSRGIPVLFRWMIKPLTDKLPRNIMLETLKDTRAAVIETAEPPPNKDQNGPQSKARE